MNSFSFQLVYINKLTLRRELNWQAIGPIIMQNLPFLGPYDFRDAENVDGIV